MNHDEPFADFDDGEATILKPIPGGGRFATPSAQPAHESGLPPTEAQDLPDRKGLNPLETAAAPLLDLISGLKNTHSHPDVASLHRKLTKEIQLFDTKARQLGVHDDKTLTRTRYVLCAALDDVVLNTPWGQQFGWSHKTLQGTFFRKEWAGDEFFQLLDRLIQDPSNNRDLLELMYICLALGFKGGYRVYDRHSELEDRREKLYRVLRGLHGDFEPELSPHWRGVIDKRNPVVRHVPLWVVAAVTALLLVLLFIFFNLRINSVADPIFTGLQGVRGELPIRPKDEYFPPPEPPKEKQLTAEEAHQLLRQQLLAEQCLDTGNVVVGQGADKKTVGTYIRTNANCKVLFDSGKWDVKPDFQRLLLRVTQALGEVFDKAPGRVLITGHTDNIPGRFISNAELSQNRAEAVMQILAGTLGSSTRFRAEGRSDSEPIASNKTKQGRAQNRRVEILVLYPHIVL